VQHPAVRVEHADDHRAQHRGHARCSRLS
jgi:hypothetical protein